MEQEDFVAQKKVLQLEHRLVSDDSELAVQEQEFLFHHFCHGMFFVQNELTNKILKLATCAF